MLKKLSIKNFLAEVEDKTLTTPRKIALRVGKFLYLWRREIARDQLLQKAGSLTYTTILAIFPLMAILAFFIPVIFKGAKDIETRIMGYLEQIIMPSAGQDIQQTIHSYFESFRENSTTLGIFGTLGLLIAAVLLFSSVEKSFNQIWRARKHRNMVVVFSRFTAVLVIVPFMIAGSIVLTAELKQRVEIVGRLFTYLVPYLLTVTAITMGYFVMPNTKVKFFYAFIGGIVAGLLWETAKVVFGYYVASPKIETLYKSIGAIPIFLIWTYYTWLIVLTGAEFTFVLQNFNRLKRETFRRDSFNIYDSNLLFSIYLTIAEHFYERESGIDLMALQRRIPMTIGQMEKAISILKNGRAVEETEKGLFIPARPLDKTHPFDILKLGSCPQNFFNLEDKDTEVVSNVLKNLEERTIEWSRERTIEDILKKRTA